MSGSTIGGAIGAVVGFWVGGPQGAQVGWMVGSAVGGYVDPTQVQGPRLQDLRGQTSQVGGAIPRAWGTAPVPGNIIWQQPGVTEHKNTDDGKGSGTEQVTYTYTRSYAIMFHLGEIAGVLQIKRNGKIVYDARDEATLQAEYEASLGPVEGVSGYLNRVKLQHAMNSRFMARCKIYTGTQTQDPDPTIEAYEGVGNAPAYRGRAYMVVTDDETQAGEIAQYEIVVAVEGTITDNTTDSYSVAGYSRFAPTTFPLVNDPEANYSYQVNLSGVGTYETTSLSDALAWSDANDGRVGAPEYLIGFLRGSGPWSGSAVPMIGHGSTDDLMDARNLWLCYQWREPAEIFDDVWIVGGVNLYGHYTGDTTTWFADSRGYVFKFNGPSSITFELPMALLVNDDRIVPPVDAPGPNERAIPDAPGFVVDITSGAVRPIYTYSATPVSDAFLCLAQETAGPTEYVQRQLNPVILATDPLNVEAWWNDRYAEAVAAGTMPSGMTYQANGLGGSTTYPRTQGTAYPAVPDDNAQSITPLTTTDGEIVAAMCDLSGLTADEYDVAQLVTTLDGFVVARETDAASVIESLRHVGLFDPAEWDGKFRGIKRTGVALASINGDDLVERDGDAFQRELVQEAELLRKVSVGYLDTTAAWAPNTQAWERTAGTVNARGESVIEVSAVMGHAQAATIAKRKGLVSWGEPEKQMFSLPYRLAALTPTDVINYTHTDGEIFQIRLMDIQDDEGVRHIESASNCPEAYSLVASGVGPKPPTVTGGGSLLGPTEAVYMNLPSLRTQDNVPGITIAATGITSGWTGAAIYMSRDGGESYQQVTTFTTPSTMGVLTASVTTSSEPISVRMTNGELESVTAAQVSAGLNVFAITSLGISEVGAFETATPTADREYDLTDTYRGQSGTTSATHIAGDDFVLADTSQFVPLDISLAGRTLYFKAVTFGTSIDAAEAVPFVYMPQFTSVTVSPITVGGEQITVGGQPIYVVN